MESIFTILIGVILLFLYIKKRVKPLSITPITYKIDKN